MQCPECQIENRKIRKFCLECGAKLVLVCGECGFENWEVRQSDTVKI